MMNFLIAFDKFKGALPARVACSIARDTVAKLDTAAEIETAPLTDGGEGFATILAEVLGGELNRVEVPGPRFDPVEGKFALVEAKTLPRHALERLNLHAHATSGLVAFVEMASASGYECLADDERDPWKTTTYGTGILMKAAAEAGAKALILGIGGSATNDCGAGALEALGVCFYDRELQAIRNVVPEKFRQINTVGSTSHLLDAFPAVRIACDVTNPLLGGNGATRIYGPQKGLKEEDQDHMERTMRKMATRFLGLFGRNPAQWDRLMAEPGSGAAGGIGFALRHALPDAAFVEGFPLVADLLDLPAKVRLADFILTGEGRLDKSSLAGKGPVALARMADAPKQVFLFAGSIDEQSAHDLKAAHPNLHLVPISDPQWPLEKALVETPAALEQALTRSLLQ
jgi:glycerate kinase